MRIAQRKSPYPQGGISERGLVDLRSSSLSEDVFMDAFRHAEGLVAIQSLFAKVEEADGNNDRLAAHVGRLTALGHEQEAPLEFSQIRRRYSWWCGTKKAARGCTSIVCGRQ